MGPPQQADRVCAGSAPRASGSHRLGDVVQPRQLGPAGLGEQPRTHASTTGSAGGAVAVKVWKDVGMVLKDPDGKYVMADDPRLDPVFSALAKQGRTLVAHLGEPRNCWLPVDQMTVDGDRRYFAATSRVPRAAASGDPELRSPGRGARPDAGAPSDTAGRRLPSRQPGVRRRRTGEAAGQVSPTWPSTCRPGSSTFRFSRVTRSWRFS